MSEGSAEKKLDLDDGRKAPYRCPFCGSKVIGVETSGSSDPETHWVECYSCEAVGPSALHRQIAVIMWNMPGRVL